MKKYSTSLIMRDIKITTVIDFLYILTRWIKLKEPTTNEEVGKLEFSCISSWNVRHFKKFGK